MLALKNEKGDFFLKSDCLKQLITLGCNHRHGLNAFHSVELGYDVKGKMAGMFGQPLSLLWAG